MILCCGEALIDMVPEKTLTGSVGFVPHPGGAIFNTAIALGRLGVRAGMLTGLSRDQFGQQLLDELNASHVETGYIALSDRPTTLAFVHLDGGQATYTFLDENSAGRMVSRDDLPAIGAEVSAMYFGGISLACEPACDTYLALAQSAGPGRAVMLDPNIRTAFIEDEDRYRARLARMIALADIVKVSDQDLEWLCPDQANLEDMAADLRSRGPKVVIVTRGADGASAWAEGVEAVHVPSLPVQVVDTVGAGDTFNAGVLAALSRQGLLTKAALATLTRAALSDALNFGSAVAAVTVSRAGANPPWPHELNAATGRQV